jgi:esterase/lipase superfamily enzyme
MFIAFDGASLLALGTAVLMYGLAWYVVRKRSLTLRVLTRTVLLAVVVAPLAYVVWTERSPQSSTASQSKPGAATRAPDANPPRVAAVPSAGPASRPTAEPEPPASITAPPAVILAPPAAVTPPISQQPTARKVPNIEPLWDVIPVYYGTDRARATAPARLTYGADRASRLELGRADVTVPKLHQVPNIERPWAVTVPFTSITLYEQTEDPARHFTIREIKSLTRDEFTAVVRARLAKSVTFKDRAVVFIHGYNTAFDYALYRTAQMAYDLRFDGVPFLYSWPSASGVTGYVYDRDSAEQSEPYLRQFLELVIKESGAKSVSLIAHSMGNLPLLRVLRDIEPHLPAGVKLDQIILAAPDVDRSLFEQLAQNITKVGRGVTLYASRNDRAMAAARLVAGGVPRAGDVPTDGPVVLAGIDTIDISTTSTDALMLNHSVYAERNALLTDIARLLQTGERPPDRRSPNLSRVITPKGDYWRYP